MRQAWEGEDGAPKASDHAIAAAIWDLAGDEERFVVGVLDQTCQGHWATESATKRNFSTGIAPTAAARAAAIAAFKALPRYPSTSARYRLCVSRSAPGYRRSSSA